MFGVGSQSTIKSVSAAYKAIENIVARLAAA